eukprot:TRINITY_DN1948_c0_g1_i2.p1 TRINITY_DN1948_c0_g1~~TRINITY_DN1948_c0_g1_i2.p1  ORF type:complete len:240 (-),score=53.55 TRINITY_DN1948_c0_g1_i2:11-730(-)
MEVKNQIVSNFHTSMICVIIIIIDNITIEIWEKFHIYSLKLFFSKKVITECKVVDTNLNLREVINLILNQKQRLLLGNGNTITNVISPFVLMKFLNSKKDLKVLSQTLSESKVKIASPFQKIGFNQSAILAFAKMVDGGFSGVAIFDEDKIITTITFKDISYALKDFNFLLETTEEYVKNVRQSRIETTTYPTINVNITDTLQTLSDKFVAVKSHRVFVRKGETLFGIVTVSDFLQAFI